MLLRRVLKLNQLRIPCRMMASKQDEIIKKKGTGEEQYYMNKQDYKKLTNLLQKMQSQILDSQPEEKKALGQLEEKQLRDILQKHETRISESMFNEILEWKRDQIL